MKSLLSWLVLTFFLLAQTAYAEEAFDKRTSLGLTAEEKAEFLSEMRQMLVSIQGILIGIANDDQEMIVNAARYSGNRMGRATPQSVRDKLPQGFKEIGGPTHLMFEELIIRTDTDEAEDLIAFTGKLMNQCTTCHALYKAD